MLRSSMPSRQTLIVDSCVPILKPFYIGVIDVIFFQAATPCVNTLPVA